MQKCDLGFYLCVREFESGRTNVCTDIGNVCVCVCVRARVRVSHAQSRPEVKYRYIGQVGSRDDARDLYSKGPQFNTRPGQRLI